MKTLLTFASALNEAFNPELDWFRLAPFGDFPVDITDPKTGGRRRVIQRVDQEAADAMVASFNSVIDRIARGFRGLPIFAGHVDDPQWRKENPGVTREAVGRMKELQKRADGIWARRALNDEGKRLLSGDAAPYDAHSPHWGMTEIAKNVFRPVELYSTALTNNPNLPGTAIGVNEAVAAENSPVMKIKLIALLAALGRPIADAANVTDDQLAAAVNDATPVAEKLVTANSELSGLRSQLSGLQTQLTTAANEKAALATQLTAERTARADVILTTAVNEGRITAAQKPEWLAKLTATNADFAAVSGDLAKLKKAINTQSKSVGLGQRRSVSPESKTRVAAVNEAITAKMKAMGITDRAAAYNALRIEKPELFSNANAE